MATCKRCGKDYEYNDDKGYSEDICGPFCDGVLSQQSKITKLQAESDALKAALQKIADYDHDGTGCCVYGCDTPSIAKQALSGR